MDVRVGLWRNLRAKELWCWRRLLRVLWTERRSNQSILKEISPACSFEVKWSRSVMSDSLRPHEPQHASPPYPSPTAYVHWVSDAIQPSHPLLSPSPPAPNPSQHQSLFQWVNSSYEVQSTGVSALASFLPKNTQGWSPLEWTDWISLQSKGLSRVFSNTTVQTTNSSILAWRIL